MSTNKNSENDSTDNKSSHSNVHGDDDLSHLGAVGGGTDARLDNGNEDDQDVNSFFCVRPETGIGDHGKSRSRSFAFRKKKSDKPKDGNKKRKTFWSFRLKNKLSGQSRKGVSHGIPEPRSNPDNGGCVCTGYRRKENETNDPDMLPFNQESFRRYARSDPFSLAAMLNVFVPAPTRVPYGSLAAMIDMAAFNPNDYPVEDIDAINIRMRAREMERGIEISSPYPHFQAVNRQNDNRQSPVRELNRHLSHGPSSAASASAHVAHFDADLAIASLTNALQNHCIGSSSNMYPPTYPTPLPLPHNQPTTSPESNRSQIYGEYNYGESSSIIQPQYTPHKYAVHTQIDYIHCLVPDLKNIVNCSFYWGVMDRYEAERLLENKPEGTFLLRDSAQEEFLFSVSFRRYGRSLHARIEQWNHKFSFDSHDPGVYASDTVCELIEHYKDPSCCMFFEPMLILPLSRNFPFSLQRLCRGVICNNASYDALSHLPLPKPLKQYLKYYHYKQKVCVRKFDK